MQLHSFSCTTAATQLQLSNAATTTQRQRQTFTDNKTFTELHLQQCNGKTNNYITTTKGLRLHNYNDITATIEHQRLTSNYRTGPACVHLQCYTYNLQLHNYNINTTTTKLQLQHRTHNIAYAHMQLSNYSHTHDEHMNNNYNNRAASRHLHIYNNRTTATEPQLHNDN